MLVDVDTIDQLLTSSSSQLQQLHLDDSTDGIINSIYELVNQRIIEI